MSNICSPSWRSAACAERRSADGEHRDKYANYCCNGGPGKFCVARKQQWVDAYVTDVVIE